MGKFFENVGALVLVALLAFVAFGIIVILFWQYITTQPTPLG